jgi:hypothetical protein
MIHLEVVVADTADLLDPSAYDAGALLRWESSATIAGVYVEGGTVALVADVSLYDIWDSAGVLGTWYRTRISDAGGTTFSPYSTPFQTAEHGLYLSVDQFRLLAPSTLTDEALLILLDAAAEEIARCVGAMGETTEWLTPAGNLLMLGRPALSITSITENWNWQPTITLDPDDYEVSASGQTIRRLSTGTNPAWRWYQPSVTYLPQDDLATRQRVQAELVKLSIAFSPGLASQRIGDWTETYTAAGMPSYPEQREALLATLSYGIGIR